VRTWAPDGDGLPAAALPVPSENGMPLVTAAHASNANPRVYLNDELTDFELIFM